MLIRYFLWMNGNSLNFDFFPYIGPIKPLMYVYISPLKGISVNIPRIFESNTLQCTMEYQGGYWKVYLMLEWCLLTLRILPCLTTPIKLIQKYSIFGKNKSNEISSPADDQKWFWKNSLKYWKHKILHRIIRGILSTLWPTWIYIKWYNFPLIFWSLL